MPETLRHVAILGGGISGLSAAWFLKKRFKGEVKLTLIEQDSHAGGWIRSFNKEGYLFELGPHSFRVPNAIHPIMELIDGLDLRSELIKANPCARHRFLYLQNRLMPIPSNPLSLLTTRLGRVILGGLWNDFWSSKGSMDDESVYDFFSRRMGASFVDNFIDPLISGIYAGDPKKLSLRSSFPLAYEYEQKHGGLLKGFLFEPKGKGGGVFSFKKGMETLIKQLVTEFQEDLLLSKSVVRLDSHSDHITLHFSDGTHFSADHLISTIPSQSLNAILRDQDFIGEIPRESVVSVSLGYDQQVIDKKGFGYLIPSSEKEQILGVIWDSLVFPEQNHLNQMSRLTVMMKKSQGEKTIDTVLHVLSKHLGINVLPTQIHLHEASLSIPQYPVGHANNINKMACILQKTHPRLTLGGSSFYGVSVPDCVRRSHHIAHSI